MGQSSHPASHPGIEVCLLAQALFLHRVRRRTVSEGDNRVDADGIMAVDQILEIQLVYKSLFDVLGIGRKPVTEFPSIN